MFFHSPCSRLISAAAASQSVESCSASARTISASFFVRFSPHTFLRSARSAWRLVKKRSQAARKRSHTAFSWPRVTGPIVFHSFCSVLISSAVFCLKKKKKQYTTNHIVKATGRFHHNTPSHCPRTHRLLTSPQAKIQTAAHT